MLPIMMAPPALLPARVSRSPEEVVLRGGEEGPEEGLVVGGASPVRAAMAAASAKLVLPSAGLEITELRPLLIPLVLDRKSVV